MRFARLGFLLAAPLLLASCLLTPGKFTSTLDIRADRSFTFTYVGEVVFVDPAEAMAQGMAEGLAAGATEPVDEAGRSADGSGDVPDEAEAAPPPTPAASAAEPKVETPAKIAERRALAETLAKEEGYRSVEYLGNNKFRIDYSMSGRLDRGFLFPINLDAKALLPWIAIEVRRDNTARVTALAFGDADAAAGGMGGAGGMGPPDKGPVEREGTFTLTTDATLVMQNNEEGLAPGPGTRVVWKVTPTSKTVPTAVVRFAH
jgi:hypothetical protein